MGLSAVISALPVLICVFQTGGYLVQGHAFPVILHYKYDTTKPGPPSTIRHRNGHNFLNIHEGIPYSGNQRETRGEIQGRFKGGLFREKYWSKKLSGTLHKNFQGSVVKGQYRGRKTMYKGAVVGKYNGGVYTGIYKGYYKMRFFHGVLKPNGVLGKVFHKSRGRKFGYKRLFKLIRRGNYRTKHRPAVRVSVHREVPGTASRKRYIAMKRFLSTLNKPRFIHHKMAKKNRENVKFHQKIHLYKYKKPTYVKSHKKIHIGIYKHKRPKIVKSRKKIRVLKDINRNLSRKRFIERFMKRLKKPGFVQSKNKMAKIAGGKEKSIPVPKGVSVYKGVPVHVYKGVRGNSSRERFIRRFMKTLKKPLYVDKTSL